MDLKDLKVMDMGMRWKQQVKLKLLFKFPQTIFIMYTFLQAQADTEKYID